MAETQTVGYETLNATLESLKAVRSSANNFFKMLHECGEEEDKQTWSNIQKKIVTFHNSMRHLNQQVINLPTPEPLSLGDTGLLCMDPAPDKLPLYHQLLDCYTWTDKVHNYAGYVHSLLNVNNLKRSQITSTSMKKRRPTQSTHNISYMLVNKVVESVNQMFQDMKLTITRPNGCNAICQITLSQILKAVVTFRGLLIESVTVRGFNEHLTDEDGRALIYESSRYRVFQKVTDSANAAMLHFYSAGYPDLSVRSFFTWLHSYTTLFTDVCRKCGYHLCNQMPPTWREFRTLHPYHEECRP